MGLISMISKIANLLANLLFIFETVFNYVSYFYLNCISEVFLIDLTIFFYYIFQKVILI